MKLVNGTFTLLKNKYFIAISFFVVWMLFFDARDWGLITDNKNKLEELQKSEKHLSAQISDTRKELDMLKTSAQTIEEYAREKYYMKKDNEDLFIV
ncbi:MAG: septum formation initiator family protein, partial [Ferruginibacter sp.]